MYRYVCIKDRYINGQIYVQICMYNRQIHKCIDICIDIQIDNMQVDSFSVMLICGPQEAKYNTRKIDR